MRKKGFREINPPVSFPKIEEEILAFWQKEKIFEKSLKNRLGAKKFTFYDGPPFATGLPHYGHILAMTIKDAITRLKTMQGYYVPRRLGWDTHGLPVEYELEKELGISGKKQIEEMGVDKFNESCRAIVFRYTREWEKTIDRMGRWVDKENTYSTLSTDYMESIWWVFKSLWDKGLIYQGFKSMPYCPRCATPLSNFETNLGYKDNVEDPAIYVKFQSADDPKTYFLAWTTTPWTLPGNAALAVNPKVTYVKVKVGEGYLILAKDRLAVLDSYEDEIKIAATDLIGKKYKPLFKIGKDQILDLSAGPPAGRTGRQAKNDNAYRILPADFVTVGEGTGIVHIAPAFGEDDLELGKRENLPIIQPVDKNGEFTIVPYTGIFVKKADPMIIEHLDQSGNLYKAETIRHTYPFCWRCETPLLYFAVANWFVKVSKFQSHLVKNNSVINWTPQSIKEGRFGNWLAEARDWSISRNRFWGTPLPVWQCQKCQEFTVIGSVAQLREQALNFEELIKNGKVDLHRPYIDQLLIKCSCGGQAKRIDEVLDCWFESGSMPYAQDHYPFENKKEWEDNFPADFIAEGLDQTRGWFYTLHVLATLLFDKPAFKNIIVNGIVVDREGKKLSKRLRNYPEPEEIFDKYGADAMRLYLLGSPAAVAEDVRFSSEAVEEVVRKFLLILANVYSFFSTYANLDGWTPTRISNFKFQISNSPNILDRWILARLQELIGEIESGINNYHLPKMTRPLTDFVNDLSTWYVRRSRDRVGPTAKDTKDKNDFFQTLHYALVTFVKLLAPFAPFTSDYIYRSLQPKDRSSLFLRNKNLTEEKSVHLADFPTVDKKLINKDLIGEMRLARQLVEGAHAARKSAKINVRQPLAGLTYSLQKQLDGAIEKIIADELNVKTVHFAKGTVVNLKIDLDTKITPQLRAEGQAREIIRQIQLARKQAGTRLNEKVTVELTSWPTEFTDLIKRETQAKELVKGEKIAIRRS